MSSGKQADPTETYVLEETAITKIRSIDELAELATGQAEDSARKKPTSSSGSHGADAEVRRTNRPTHRR